MANANMGKFVSIRQQIASAVDLFIQDPRAFRRRHAPASRHNYPKRWSAWNRTIITLQDNFPIREKTGIMDNGKGPAGRFRRPLVSARSFYDRLKNVR